MPQIKLPVSEQFERVILSDAQFTVTQDGFHTFGATVGRGHQQILDISGYQSLTITASSSLGLTGRGEVRVILFDENGRLTGGAEPWQDPAVVGRYERPLTAPGTITMGESLANRIDTSGAVGAVVAFFNGQAGADLQVRVLGERNNKQLEAIREAQGSALLASGEISVSLAGNHYFGETSGRGYQEVLDVSAYETMIVTVDAEGVPGDQIAAVLLYDKADMVPTGRDASSDPEIVKFVGNLPASGGTRHVYRVDVTDVQGAVVEFLFLPVGATIKVRVTGSKGRIKEVGVDRSIERIAEVSLSHADLFDGGGAALTKIYNWSTTKYRHIIFYATSSFPVPFTIRCLEVEGGLASMIKWDGDAFDRPRSTGAYDTVTIPAVSTTTGSKYIAKFPIHHALRLLQDGVYTLQTRVIAEAVSDATDPSGNPYVLELTIFGVK